MIRNKSHIEKREVNNISVSSNDARHRPITKDDYVHIANPPKRTFWKHTPFGRTLSLRNKTGKTITSVALSLVGIYTGIEFNFIPKQTIEPMFLLFSNTQLLELINDPIALIVTIALLLFTVFSGWLIHKGFITDRISTEIKEVLSKVKDARDPDSPGGAEFTKEERAIILAEGIDVIESVLEKYGIDIDLDGDGK